ncbi:MAG: STAS domain-containing protein [Bacillota bacterium]|nr:STAS domain-containing protein [Bacillota bacterium]
METVDLNIYQEEITRTIILRKEELALQREAADEVVYSNKISDSLTSWRKNLIDIYAYSISRSKDETFTRLKEWGDHVVNLMVNLQLPLDIAIEEVRFYRDSIGNIIKEEAKKHGFTIDVFYETLSRFDSVVDQAVHWLSLSYSKTYSANILSAEYAMYELSIPLVRVTKDIGVLPIVGDLDTKRAQQLMDRALEQGTSYNLTYMIIDLSGVPIIDTMVADQLFKVISSLKLVGIETCLTGIRPEIAQTMVNLGIDFKSILTFSSLHQALGNLQRSKK